MNVAEVADRIAASMAQAVLGRREAIRLCLVACFGEGHVLLDDFFSSDRLLFASALAKSIGCSCMRLQCTTDLLPADVIGTSNFDPKAGEILRFDPGPIFHQTLVITDLDLAPPDVQAVFLEAMTERRVRVDAHVRPLESPFLVIAAPSTLDREGPFPPSPPLLDRFLVGVGLGVPDAEESYNLTSQCNEIPTAIQHADLLACQEAVRAVHVDDLLRKYILNIIEAAREGEDALAGRPQAAPALLRAAQAHAALAGRNFVLPDDVERMVQPVLAHRLVLRDEERLQHITPASARWRARRDVRARFLARLLERALHSRRNSRCFSR
jgi:MoxR-like ATPase